MAQQAALYLIRDYRETDFPRLYQIDRICFPPGISYSRAELLYYLRRRDAITKTAESDRAIVGFAVGHPRDDRTGHVITLDVLPDARRMGIGTALMTSLHREFLQRGTNATYLEADAEDTGALGFYASLGYEEIERLRGYYAGGRDAVRMVRFFG